MQNPIQLHWTVRELLQAFPAAARSLLALKTDCLGCPMQRFCSLADVADTYALAPETLMAALRQTVESSFEEK